MKLGIDVHGVIDRHPIVFSNMANAVIGGGGEVHVITGAPETDEIKDHLSDLGIPWTEFFSITDQLLFEEYIPTYSETGGMWFPDDIWNPMKGHYCSLHNIDLHFDDTAEYGQYFSTPFALWPQDDSVWCPN